MLLPGTLPPELLPYASVENEAELFNQLSKHAEHIILFFEIASENETWSEQHAGFMGKVIDWCTKHFLDERLSILSAERIAAAIRKHFSIFRSILPSDLTIHMQGHQVVVNSLILSVSSEVFRERIRIECHIQGGSSLVCNEVSFALFHHIVECAYTGMALNLWRERQEDLMSLLRFCSLYKLVELMEICEETLRRYINRSNALEMLEMSYKESWNHLKKHCMEILNEQSLGVNFFVVQVGNDSGILEPINPFGMEFLAFSESALELFEHVKRFITHLICGGALTEETPFSYVVSSCPNLVALDISHTRAFSDRLSDIPSDLIELDLSQCPWLTNSVLHRMVLICPHLKRLKLQSNVQLTYLGWSELQKLRQLQAVDISRCHQVNDEDFVMILKACGHVVEFRADECKKLTDRAFFSLAKSMPQVLVLSVGRCHLSDGMLLEIVVHCRHLFSLNLTKCLDITEKGLLKVIQQTRELRRLNVSQCRLSDEEIARIRKSYPLLRIEKTG